MKMQTGCGLALALLCGVVPVARSQVGLPAAGGVPPAAGAAGLAGPAAAQPPVAAAPAAAPRNLWSFLCPTAEQKAECKEKICKSMIGQLLNNSLKPASAFTGGVIPE